MNIRVLVSVIIPAYNAERYIAETLHSVLTQSHSNMEVIVVNDGSTDNTVRIVETIGKKDPRIKILHQTNQGVSVARNNGFAVSKGSYIVYMDADDLWATDNIESKLLKFNSDKEYGLVHSDSEVIDENSQRTNEIHHGYEGYLLDNLLLGGKWVNGTSGSLVKREIVEAVGGFDPDLAYGEDNEFYFRVANKSKIGRIERVTWYYRIHSNNTHFNINLLEKDALAIYKKADQHNLFKNRIFRRKCYSNVYFMLAGSFWPRKGNKLKAINYLLYSILYYPPVLWTVVKKITR